MKKFLLILITVAVSGVFMGCLQSEIEVTVNKDGSGTIEQTFLLNGDLTAMMSFAMEPEDDSDDKDSDSDQGVSLYDEDELKAMAAALGKGVRYISSEPVTTEWGEGFTVKFSFSNIEDVRINQNPGEFVPSDMMSMGMPDETEEEEEITEYITFDFKKGATSVLTIHLPENYDGEESAETEEGGMEPVDPSEAMMMKEFFRGMRIAMIMHFNGTITKTNAAYKKGSSVTLLDLDFSSIIEDDQAFMKLMGSNPETVEEMKQLFEDTPGIEGEFQDTVTVSFR
ncbi:MAG: hypothetical protein ACLFST_07760 [Spirochaetia bacterium]